MLKNKKMPHDIEISSDDSDEKNSDEKNSSKQN